MTDMRISDLPQAPNVNDAQQFEVNDSGNSRRVTFQQMRETIKAQADNLYAAKNHTHTAEEISNATAIGRAVLTSANPDIARATIQAKAETWIPHVANDTTGQLPWERLSGVPSNNTSPALNAYTAGDNFNIGFFQNEIVAYRTNNTWYFPPIGHFLTSNGVIRIRLQQKGECLIRINDIDVAYWYIQPTDTNWTDRSIDVAVSYGQIIRIGIKTNGLTKNTGLRNVFFRTNTPAPIMIQFTALSSGTIT